MIPTAEVIVFPPVEAVAIARLTGYFSTAGDNVFVTDTIPSPDRPGRLIKAMVGGPSSRPNLTTALRSVIFECWDEDRSDADALSQIAYAVAMATRGAVGNTFVRYVESVGEPTYFPDPRTDLPRYQFTVSFALKGRAV